VNLAQLDAAHVFDVAVVGGGPAGAATAYWLAAAGWDVVLFEKKHFPRVKTCGDGLTPRSVRQVLDMGLGDDVLAKGHQYHGLRAFGFGASCEMMWPEHPTFPNYGVAITRHDLDELVVRQAEHHGATIVEGAEVLDVVGAQPNPAGGLGSFDALTVRDKDNDATVTVRATYYVLADGQNSRIGRTLGVTRRDDWPMGMALRGYYTSERSADDFIESHLDIRSPEGDIVPGYGWIFPLGDGRINVGVGLLSTDRRWKGVNTTKLQDYFVDQIADRWGCSPETSLGAPTGGRLPMGLARSPRVGGNVLTVGDAAATINPFNGEGIAYGYETGRMAASVLATAIINKDPEVLRSYDDLIDAAYGDYYKVARAFVRIVSEPRILAACVGLGLRVEPLMQQLLVVMANLMTPGAKGPAEVGFRALARLVDVIPEKAYDLLLGAAS
jgi:menaquinone-9 beta-reductase